MKIKAPEDVKEYIRSKFVLSCTGEVRYKRDKNPQFGTCAKFNGNNYSMSYVKDVLEGKDPDLSVLFDTIEGKLYRNQDPVWSIYKGTKVSEKGAKICGVLVTQEGIKEILERPVFHKIEPKHIELKRDTLALEPLVASEYERWCINDRFRLKEGEVVYFRGDKPFGDSTTIDGMRYSKSYVQQVLEGKDPDISDLFELRDGVIYRNQDPFWGQAKGTPFKLSIICGGIFIAKGCVETEPEQLEPEQSEPEDRANLD